MSRHKELTELAQLVYGDRAEVWQFDIQYNRTQIEYRINIDDEYGEQLDVSGLTTVSQVASVLLEEMLTRADKFCGLYFKLLEQEYDE